MNEKKAKAKEEAEAKKAAEAAEVASILAELAAVPKGAKKPVGRDNMYKTYHPKMVEAAWYEW